MRQGRMSHVRLMDLWYWSQSHCSKEDQQMIGLRLDGLTFEEIGESLGLSKQGAHERFRKIREKRARWGREVNGV